MSKATILMVGIDLDDLAEQVARNLSHGDLLSFVCDIDDNVADFDFTMEIAKRMVQVIYNEYQASGQLFDLDMFAPKES